MSTNEYMKLYLKERYHSDPEFRQRVINSSSKWQRNNKDYVNKLQRIRYANRTEKQIEARKRYLKRLRSKK